MHNPAVVIFVARRCIIQQWSFSAGRYSLIVAVFWHHRTRGRTWVMRRLCNQYGCWRLAIDLPHPRGTPGSPFRGRCMETGRVDSKGSSNNTCPGFCSWWPHWPRMQWAFTFTCRWLDWHGHAPLSIMQAK